MKTTKILISTLALSIILTALSPAANAIGVTPLRAFLKAAPGETVEGSVIAQNTGDTQQIVTLSKADFLVKEDESMQFIPDVKTDNMYSMQNWIEFEKNDVLTEPKGGAEMKYKITVPADAASHAYYAAIFVQGKSPTAGEGAVSVGASVAHLILLEVTGGDLKASLEFKSFEMTKPETREGQEPKDEAQFKTVVFNTGNTHIAPDGMIKIYDSTRTHKEDVLLNRDQYNAMPNRSKTITNKFDYSKYEAGNFYAELNLKSGEYMYDAYIPFTINADRTLVIGQMKTGKIPAEAEIAAQAAQAQGPLFPDWAPIAIGAAAGLIFVFGLVAYLLKKGGGRNGNGKKNGKK